MLKEEKKNIKLRQKDQLKKLYEQQRDVPEVSHLIEDEQDKPTMTFELPNQFVNITMFDTNQMAGQLGYMGLNSTENSHEESEQVQEQPDEGEDEDEEEEKSDDLINRITKTKKLVKKQTLNDLKKSKAFQVKQKQKHSNDLKKSKLFRKKLKREMKNSKLKSRTSKSKKRKDKRKKIK